MTGKPSIGGAANQCGTKSHLTNSQYYSEGQTSGLLYEV